MIHDWLMIIWMNIFSGLRKLVSLGVIVDIVETWQRERRGESGDDNRLFDACCDIEIRCFDWGDLWLCLAAVACCLVDYPIIKSENLGERYSSDRQTADGILVVVELRRHQLLLACHCVWHRNLIRNSNFYLTAELLALAQLASRFFHKMRVLGLISANIFNNNVEKMDKVIFASRSSDYFLAFL